MSIVQTSFCYTYLSNASWNKNKIRSKVRSARNESRVAIWSRILEWMSSRKYGSASFFFSSPYEMFFLQQ